MYSGTKLANSFHGIDRRKREVENENSEEEAQDLELYDITFSNLQSESNSTEESFFDKEVPVIEVAEKLAHILQNIAEKELGSSMLKVTLVMKHHSCNENNGLIFFIRNLNLCYDYYFIILENCLECYIND